MKKIFSLFLSLTFVVFLAQAQNVVEPSVNPTEVKSQTLSPTIPAQQGSIKVEQNVNTENQTKVNEEEVEVKTVQSNLSSHDKTNCNPANCKKKMQCHGNNKTSAKDDAAGQTINETKEVRQINSTSTPVDNKLQIANTEEMKQVAAPLK